MEVWLLWFEKRRLYGAIAQNAKILKITYSQDTLTKTTIWQVDKAIQTYDLRAFRR